MRGVTARDGGATRRAVRVVLVFVVAFATVVVATAPGAAADEDCTLEPYHDGGELRYRVVCPGDDGDEGSSGGGSGGGSGPTCELTGLYDYCIGDVACWANVPSALDPETWPEETRPSPEAIYTFQYCEGGTDNPLTGWSWYTPQEMTVGEAARQAFGRLVTPAFEVGFNPPGRAVVQVPTWFWAEGAGSGVITGSSALGVVAIGEPDRVEVDPGDGSAVLACGWQTTASDGCTYTYPRASVGQPPGGPEGLPAYTARMRLVYEVRFQVNGVTLSVPGLPTSLESAWQETAVPVAEIQAVVTYGT